MGLDGDARIWTGDLDGDGADEIVTPLEEPEGEWTLLVSSSVGTVTYEAPPSFRDLGIVDFDQDGDQDLVAAGSHEDRDALWLVRNDGTGQLTERMAFPLRSRADDIAVGRVSKAPAVFVGASAHNEGSWFEVLRVRP